MTIHPVNTKARMMEVQPLFEKQFKCAEYLYAEPASPDVRSKKKKQGSGTNWQADNQPQKFTDQETEEVMLSTLEKVEIVRGVDERDGGQGRVAMLPAEQWHRLKRFVANTISSKRDFEHQVHKSQKKLSIYKELEGLEHRIAQLQSHRIELTREMALRESGFAEEHTLKQKMEDVLSKCDTWAGSMKDLYSSLSTEKQAYDRLRRGLDWLKDFPELKSKHCPHDAKGNMNVDLDQNESLLGGECRILFRGSRLISNRYCIVTIYIHISGTARPSHWPYLEPTFSLADGGASGVAGGMGTEGESSGLGMLMKNLMQEHMDADAGRSGGKPVLLVAVYDVLFSEYYMLETLPAEEEMREIQRAQKNTAAGSASATNSEGALHAALNQYIKNIVDKLTLKKDNVGNGKLIVNFPNQKMPMRTLWTGHHELHGAVGMFHISVYDYDHKNFLVRMYDSRCCRLFSHFVPKDFLPSDDEEFRSDFGSEADAERYRVSILLKRLSLSDRGLSLREQGMGLNQLIKDRSGTESWQLGGGGAATSSGKLGVAAKEGSYLSIGSDGGSALKLETLDASKRVHLKPQIHLSEVMSLRPQAARFWPQELQVDMARRYGPQRAYLLLRAAVCAEKDALHVLMYDPTALTIEAVYDQCFSFSEACRNFHDELKHTQKLITSEKSDEKDMKGKARASVESLDLILEGPKKKEHQASSQEAMFKRLLATLSTVLHQAGWS